MHMGAAGAATDSSQSAPGNAFTTTKTIGADTGVGIPANTVHNISVAADATEPCVFMAVCAPSWTPTCSVFIKDLAE
jgi:hypothetical protein